MEGDIDITGILSGDAEEFRTLFYRWYPKIRGFINCLVKSDAVSEDLTQDIFLRIWKDRDMLGNIASIESYMYRMARNMSLNWLKHRKVETGYDYTVLTSRFYNAYNGVDICQYPEDNGELQKLLDRRNDKTEQPGRPWVEVGSDGRYYYYGNFDWFNYFYRKTRPQQEYNISVTGGGEKFNYYVSGRFLQQKGVFRIFGDTYSDVSFRAKMSAKIRP